MDGRDWERGRARRAEAALALCAVAEAAEAQLEQQRQQKAQLDAAAERQHVSTTLEQSQQLVSMDNSAIVSSPRENASSLLLT